MINVPLLMRHLTVLFWQLAAPAAVLLVGGSLVRRLYGPLALPAGGPQPWGTAALVLAVACGVALPILIRTLFNQRAVQDKRADPTAFRRYQARLVVVPLLAAYVAAAASLFALGRLHIYGSVLAALYGAYSAYPVQRKLIGEMRYYGLKAETK